MSLSLPGDAEEGDELIFEALVTDASRVDPIRNIFVLKVKAERKVKSGPPGQRSGGGNDTGSGKGAQGKGQDQTQDSFLDIPEPIQVYEKDWKNHDPEFDKFTSIRIKRPPNAEGDEERYDYYINMSNIHLQTYMKARPKLAAAMKLRFSVGMTLVALAVLHQEQLRRKKGRVSEDMPDDAVDVRDRVAQTTCALAPFLLPMIESVSVLDEEEVYHSESAGEAA